MPCQFRPAEFYRDPITHQQLPTRHVLCANEREIPTLTWYYATTDYWHNKVRLETVQLPHPSEAERKQGAAQHPRTLRFVLALRTSERFSSPSLRQAQRLLASPLQSSLGPASQSYTDHI